MDLIDIFESARKGKIDVIDKILLQNANSVNIADWGGNTPIQIACMLRNYEGITFPTQSPINNCINIINSPTSPTTVAARLLERGANPLLLDGSGKNAFNYIRDPMVMETLKRKYAKAAKIDLNDMYDYTLTVAEQEFVKVREAAYSGNIVEIKRFYEMDSNVVHKTDRKGHSALMFACMAGQMEVATFLVEKGSDIRLRCDYAVDSIGFLIDPHKKKTLIELAFRVSPAGIAHFAAIAARLAAEETARRDLEIKSMHGEDVAMKWYLRKLVDITNKVRRAYVRKMVTSGLTSCVESAVVTILRLEEEEFQRQQQELRLEASERTHMKAEENDTRMLLLKQKQLREVEEKKRLQALQEAAEQARVADEMKRAAVEAVRQRKLKEAREILLREAEMKAMVEWNVLEASRVRQAAVNFVNDKPKRLQNYKRVRLGASKF